MRTLRSNGVNTPRRSGRRLAAAIGLAVVVASGAIGAPLAGAAGAGPDKANHCVTASGTDLNELWGVLEPIVSPDCTQLGTGWHWRPSPGAWFVNNSFEVAPDGFVPAGATPLEDFQAKFTAVRYVVDPGTSTERTYLFENVGDLAPAVVFGFPIVNPLTMSTLTPLPAGHHVLESYWQFSAMHCDGFGDSIFPGANCFPAGETQLPTITFEVTPGRY